MLINFFSFDNLLIYLQIEENETYTPRYYGDRFIPRRYSGFPDLNCCLIREKWIYTDVIKMVCVYYYIQCLSVKLGL